MERRDGGWRREKWRQITNQTSVLRVSTTDARFSASDRDRDRKERDSRLIPGASKLFEPRISRADFSNVNIRGFLPNRARLYLSISRLSRFYCD